MPIKLTTLLRKIFLGSLAGITVGNTNQATAKESPLETDKNDSNSGFVLKYKSDLKPKLILKKASDDDWTVFSHRSHRSHSSHRSHYSSYSGGSSRKRSRYSSGSSNSGFYSSGSSVSSAPKTKTLQLGARTLKKGMKGTDVTALVILLIEKKYINWEDDKFLFWNMNPSKDKPLLFDDKVENAVKSFQSDNGLKSDGVCGPTTIKLLKN
jgi:hypothetical protein